MRRRSMAQIAGGLRRAAEMRCQRSTPRKRGVPGSILACANQASSHLRRLGASRFVIVNVCGFLLVLDFNNTTS